ncbi:MAG: GyrI-like domain-containing protein, partial [Actinobacteria bacterium]|nr:GyrI-like domain-containing protein [Actinomycetota bacterium]
MGDKIDLAGLHEAQYRASRKPLLVDVGGARYLAVAGRGAPDGDAFGTRIGALYAVAYTIKMTRKFEGRGDYVICKLECQWWGDGDRALDDTPRSQWNWRLMIRTPEVVTEGDLSGAVAKLLDKGKDPTVREVELVDLTEGRCVQMLHVGPYAQERETVAQMLAFAAAGGLAPRGRHHEIYLSDPRRVAPEKLRTILRLP